MEKYNLSDFIHFSHSELTSIFLLVHWALINVNRTKFRYNFFIVNAEINMSQDE